LTPGDRIFPPASSVNLGHADSAAMAKALADGVGFSDLFETADINADGTCPEGFSASNAEGRIECLEMKPGSG